MEVTDKRDRTSVITVGRAAIKEEKMADLDAEQAYSTKVKGVNVIINLKTPTSRQPSTVRSVSSAMPKDF